MTKSPKFKLSENNSLMKPKRASPKAVNPKSDLMKKVATPILKKEKPMTTPKKALAAAVSKPAKAKELIKAAATGKVVPKAEVKPAPKPTIKKTPLQRAMAAPKEQSKAKPAPAPKAVSKPVMLTTKQLLAIQEKAIVNTVG